MGGVRLVAQLSFILSDVLGCSSENGIEVSTAVLNQKQCNENRGYSTCFERICISRTYRGAWDFARCTEEARCVAHA